MFRPEGRKEMLLSPPENDLIVYVGYVLKEVDVVAKIVAKNTSKDVDCDIVSSKVSM
jgi:hypothetical protein